MHCIFKRTRRKVNVKSYNDPKNSINVDGEIKTEGSKLGALLSNPIYAQKTQHQNKRTSANRLYSGYSHNAHSKGLNINYKQLLKIFNDAIYKCNDLEKLFLEVHTILSRTTQIAYSAIGLINSQSSCINLKLTDNMGSLYNTKALLTDTDNPLVKCYLDKNIQLRKDNKFLKANYLSSSQSIILPLISNGECIGIYAIGCEDANTNIELYQFISNYLALFAHNQELQELVDLNTDTDSLTGLANHKCFHEELIRQIEVAQETSTDVSVCLFDILNLTHINNEFGHAKGDEIIKTIAKKIKQNIRNTDFAARYSGDEVAIIMPNTTTAEAKYIAEYLAYTLSCVLVDDIGRVKLSCGLATYPEASKDPQKLIILAEQAMYISKSKTYESGKSVIVTSQDYNFWDDEALKCFAEVLTKKHAQIGVDFEEELINKFHNEQIRSNKHMLEVVTSLASTIDAKDPYTKGHSTLVSRYAESLARSIRLPEAEIERIKLGALLHDIGKIGIPENVLKKPDKLNDEEWEIMKQHPTIGADKVLAPNDLLTDLIPMVKYHHEHYDGTGYPCGLKGEDIPLSARIVSIADAFHALVSDRPYRKGMSTEKACEILKLGAGSQWDKELVREFIVIAPSLSTTV